jgi:hypothetical protein
LPFYLASVNGVTNEAVGHGGGRVRIASAHCG